jgi:hypothetical protein
MENSNLHSYNDRTCPARNTLAGDALARPSGDPASGPLFLVFGRSGPVFRRGEFSETGKVFGFDLGGRTIFSADRLVDFLAMNGDIFGSGDTESHFVTADIHHGDLDIVTDLDDLIALSGQH